MQPHDYRLTPIQVDSIYYNNTLNKRWRSYLLAEEAERTVLFRSKGSPIWTYKGGFWQPEGGALEIYPHGRWYNFYYILDGAGNLSSYYINITMPPSRRSRDHLVYVDLDLDLGVNPDFSYVVYDEDEFKAHKEAWNYPEHVTRGALDALDTVLGMVYSRHAAFSEWERYLAMLPPEYITSSSAALIPHSDTAPSSMST